MDTAERRRNKSELLGIYLNIDTTFFTFTGITKQVHL